MYVYIYIYKYGGFLKLGVPPVIIHFNGIVHYKTIQPVATQCRGWDFPGFMTKGYQKHRAQI